MSNSDTCKDFFPADPDIAGVGIRISVYITILLLSLATSTTDVVSSIAGLQGIVLLVTAIIQTSLGQLSLYHAFIVLHLLSFLGFQLAPTFRATGLLANENLVTIRMVVTGLSTLSAAIAYLGWMIYLMVHAPTFGPAELQSCNDRVLYVFFFKSVHATTKWVRIVLALFGVFPLPMSIPFIGPVITAVYGVVTLELMIYRNEFIVKEGETGWGFGQLLAIVLLIQPAKEILQVLVNYIATLGAGPGRSRTIISSPGFLRANVKLIYLTRRLFSSEESIVGTELVLYNAKGKETK